jgi:hypothetical protein
MAHQTIPGSAQDLDILRRQCGHARSLVDSLLASVRHRDSRELRSAESFLEAAEQLLQQARACVEVAERRIVAAHPRA